MQPVMTKCYWGHLKKSCNGTGTIQKCNALEHKLRNFLAVRSEYN